MAKRLRIWESKDSKVWRWHASRDKVKAFFLMVSLQSGFARMYIITMVSLNHGMGHYVLVVYRHVIATIVIAPFSLVLGRQVRPKMTLSIVPKIMLLGLLEKIEMGDQRRTGNILICLERVNKAKASLLMVSLQFGYAGLYIIAKVSLNHGMSHYVFAVYRHMVATLVIAPFAFVLEREIRPKMTMPIFLKIMLLGFLEPVLDQNLYYQGMEYTTATFASASLNLTPAFTFIMAILFRLERVNIKKMHSVAKLMGTVIAILGALVMTLLKGPIIDFIRSKARSHYASSSNESAGDKHWVTGTLMLLGCACGKSGFCIVQSITLKKYPAELSLTALICLMGSVEGAAVTFVMERDINAWKVGWDSRLLASVYSGLVCSAIGYYVQGVVNKERGPVFVTCFSPLGTVITAALGAIILAENVYLGSIIGAILVTFGLYTFLWGKSKDLPSTVGSEDVHQLAVAIKNDNPIEEACHSSSK